MSENDNTINTNQTSVVTNSANGDIVDNSGMAPTPSVIAEISGSEYVYITDSNIQPNDIMESENSTILTNTNKNISSNYNHVPLQSDDQYDHTANISKNIQRQADTYSHLNNTNNVIHKSALNNKMDNVYNKIEDQRLEMDVHDEDLSYDHTNALPGKPARIEIDTYMEVDNGLDVKHEDSLYCQEDHEYFVLEMK